MSLALPEIETGLLSVTIWSLFLQNKILAMYGHIVQLLSGVYQNSGAVVLETGPFVCSTPRYLEILNFVHQATTYCSILLPFAPPGMNSTCIQPAFLTCSH